MGITTGIQVMGTYSGNSGSDIAQLLALIPNPDIPPAQAGLAGVSGTFLDEMSPIAAAQLRVEIAAMRAEAASGSYTMSAADATANQTDILTGVVGGGLATSGVVIRRAGAIVTGDAVITEPVDGTLRVAEGASTYVLTAGDIVYYTFQKA